MNKIGLQTIESMKSLGIYKPEYDQTIAIYAGLIDQYQVMEKEFKKNKLKLINSNNPNAMKPDQIIRSLEKLRKDILAYSSALGLTPSALKRITSGQPPEKKQQSKLEMALNNFG